MTGHRNSRGRPLLALLLILGGWVCFRAAFWNLADSAPVSATVRVSADPAAMLPARPFVEAVRAREAIGAEGAETALVLASTVASPAWSAMAPMSVAPPEVPAPRLSGHFDAPPPYALSGASLPPHSVQALVRNAAVRQVLWMTTPRTPLPANMALAAVGYAASEVAPEPPRPRRTRWSADGWLLLRQGGNVSLAGGPAPATYGASQAGAVLRYRLAPESSHRLSAYLRGTAALNGSAEREAALGLSARPIAMLPVVVAADIRVASQIGGTRLRPALTAYTELPPIELPRQLRGEVYVQAGYVGGRYSTPFADGQLRVDRKVETVGRAELRAGVGAWGGAQQGASRLDLGPAATVGMGLGGMGLGESASARLALDWRFRVAGNAEPSSGPALTLSAGF